MTLTDTEKDLIAVDISGRLLYGVKIHIDCIDGCKHIIGDAVLNNINTITNLYFDICDFKQDFTVKNSCSPSSFGGKYLLKLGDFKLYLRPLTDMTVEEKDECAEIFNNSMYTFIVNLWGDVESTRETVEKEQIYYDVELMYKWIDWLNKHHFDYRGLINKGLAIEVTKEMYE